MTRLAERPSGGRLRVLLVEDAEDDALLVERTLRHGGFDVFVERVQTADAMLTALRTASWDVVIADYVLPAFSAPAALDLLKAHGADIPFIVVSGVIDEETAVAAMKAGAQDCVTKQKLALLPAAVARELRDADDRARWHATEHALARERELSRRLVEGSEMLIVGLDAAQRIVVFNPAAEARTGVSRADALGRRASDVVRPATRSWHTPSRLFAPPGVPGSHEEFEQAIVAPSGEERPILWRRTTLLDGDDELACVLIGVDLSARREAEVQRRRLAAEQQAREQAEALSRSKDDVLAMVAHDLRVPLAAIRGYAALLGRPALGDEQRAAALATIDRSVAAQDQLIADLLDVTRIMSGTLRLDRRPTDASAVVAAALDVVTPMARAKRIAVTASLDPAAAVVADDARLQQVVWNLVSNAVKFTPAGGRVDVAVERADDTVVIRVTDSGIGISPEYLPSVFDRYRRGPDAPRDAAAGLGLGLAIVRHLVELHGGVVAAHSPGRGEGATFTVRLPAAGR